MPARSRITAPILAKMAQKFVTPKQVISAVTNTGTGPAGLATMLVTSDDAQAPVLDVTGTRSYQEALDKVNAGRGANADLSNWNPTTSWRPPTYQESLQGYQAQQKQVDDQIVRNGGIRPSDERILQDTNRYNLRAKARRFAPGVAY